jgi:predicted nucleic acid-binding protein
MKTETLAAMPIGDAVAPLKTYLDNVIVCGRVRSDLKPAEMAAVRQIEEAAKRGELTIVTSREAWREQDRTPNEASRARFTQDRDNVPVVRDDHRMLGSRANYDNHGQWYGTSPILTEIVDEPLFAAARKAGLEEGDARHFMYAVHNGCDRFATADRDFLNRRPQLEAFGRGMLIKRPSELVTELVSRQSAPPSPA